MPSDVNIYKQVDLNGKVANASPHRLIQMLYEASLSNLNSALHLLNSDGLKTSQLELIDRYLTKSVEVVAGLQESLDTSVDADLPHNLNRLYDYIQRRLLHARIQRDSSAIIECLSLLETLKSGWDAIQKTAVVP